MRDNSEPQPIGATKQLGVREVGHSRRMWSGFEPLPDRLRCKLAKYQREVQKWGLAPCLARVVLG